MIYDWYKIVNVTSFEALGLVSEELVLELEGLGEKSILVTKGNAISILYEGIFLTANFNENNPFAFEGHAIYVDSNNDLWLGIENES